VPARARAESGCEVKAECVAGLGRRGQSPRAAVAASTAAATTTIPTTSITATIIAATATVTARAAARGGHPAAVA
jgi:hypothetical protein